jgi:ankyrin repeat protein
VNESRTGAIVRGIFRGIIFSALSLAVFFTPGQSAVTDLSLVDAVKRLDKDAVHSLLKDKANVNAPQADGSTALAWAVYRDDLEMVRLLIRAGSNVNAANQYGVTPITLACLNRNAVIVDELLKAGANSNSALWTGETVLMTCSRTGTVEAVKALIAHKADVNAEETNHGQTALMWAIAERHPDVARVLIENKADIHAKSHPVPGLSPKIYSTYDGDLQVSSKGGFSPILFAAQQGDIETSRLLITNGANVNDSTEEDGTPLLLASANGYEDLAIFFLENGANPNVTPGDGSGIAPLHYALRDGLKSIMQGKGAGLFV